MACYRPLMRTQIPAREWTLLVIAEAYGESLSPVQLQKALFLIGENLTLEGFYRFDPYDYGPFCKTVYSDAISLASDGLVTINDPSPAGFKTYAATPTGIDRAARFRPALSPEDQEYLTRVVEWVRRLSFKDLVVAIYKAYPHMKENSVFRY